MTAEEAVSRCLTRTGVFAESDQTLTEDALFEAMPDARREFARRARRMMDDGDRQKLTKDFTTSALSSGMVSLSSLTALAEPPLLIYSGSNGYVGPFQAVRHSSVPFPLKFVGNRLNTQLPVQIPSYAIESNILFTAVPRGLPALTGTLTLTGVFIPLVENVPLEMEELFLETLVITATKWRAGQMQQAQGVA